jgi:hypothetical protein
MKQRRARHGKWRLAALGVVLLMAAGVAAFWWRADSQETSSGTPRLVVDRTDVDLGYRRFGLASGRARFLRSPTLATACCA